MSRRLRLWARDASRKPRLWTLQLVALLAERRLCRASRSATLLWTRGAGGRSRMSRRLRLWARDASRKPRLWTLLLVALVAEGGPCRASKGASARRRWLLKT